MGTTSFDFKAKGMLNFQNFTVYPISKESDFEYVKIQSDTRIGKLYLQTGVIHMSKSHPSGAYFHHLSTDVLLEFKLSNVDFEALKLHIASTTGKLVGSRGVLTDNSGAIDILDEES
tara:strand:+ start:112 stop:462 length:351 start_codon:yes stop_codon:yes gene_type:complete